MKDHCKDLLTDSTDALRGLENCNEVKTDKQALRALYLRFQTDLHVKDIDSWNYLHFGTAHPNYIYSRIAYNQCIRLKRMINSQERLKSRLDELCTSFKTAAYPSKMMNNISNKVLNSGRNLDIRPKAKANPLNSEILLIKVVSTYRADNDPIATVQKV